MVGKADGSHISTLRIVGLTIYDQMLVFFKMQDL